VAESILPSDDLVHVPTVDELVRRNLAKVVGWTSTKKPTHYQITPQGQAEINAAQAHNAAVLRAADEKREKR
jgi:hypothetical protein